MITNFRPDDWTSDIISSQTLTSLIFYTMMGLFTLQPIGPIRIKLGKKWAKNQFFRLQVRAQDIQFTHWPLCIPLASKMTSGPSENAVAQLDQLKICRDVGEGSSLRHVCKK